MAALRLEDAYYRYMGIGLSTSGVNLNRLPGGFAVLNVLLSDYSRTPLSFPRLGEELIWVSCRRRLCIQLLWYRPAVCTHLLHSRCRGLWVQPG